MKTGSWWHGAVGYQVYIRSFADSNADGIGDLEGIRSRLDYLNWLGVDALWITPFFDSPGADHGYDVSDYLGVNPIHGNLDDFDRLVEDAHIHGLRVIVDIVPNHSSSHHPWFEESRKHHDSPYRDYYLWRDPAPDGGPPNNWVSRFGGPAWTLDERTGQYYCHLFLPEQPDLNWRNDRVRAEFIDILRFWCERGADGFRIDVAHGLMKHADFPDNPRLGEPVNPIDPLNVFRSYDHRYDIDQDDTIDIFREWNKVVEPYGAVLIGELDLLHPERFARCVQAGALHTSFYLKPSAMGWQPDELLSDLRTMHAKAPQGVSWVLNNHDNSRSVTRFGDGGAERTLAAAVLMFGLGGMPFLYQGEELGLPDGDLAPGEVEDPAASRNIGAPSRDGARTAMPWDGSHQNGFTTAPGPWLHADPRPVEMTVAHQQNQFGSVLNRYRRLIAERRRHPELWSGGQWVDQHDPNVGMVRAGGVIAAANLGSGPSHLELPPGRWAPVYHSRDQGLEECEDTVSLDAETGVVLEER